MAFMSRTLTRSEQHHPVVGKEATAIIEAVCKWSHYLLGRTFMLVTDQKSLSFVFDNRKRSKIKNSNIMLWRIELGFYSYNIAYKRGQQNVAPDTLSRVCASIQSSNLDCIHQKLGHPGVTRLTHFVRMKNLLCFFLRKLLHSIVRQQIGCIAPPPVCHFKGEESVNCFFKLGLFTAQLVSATVELQAWKL